MAAVVVYRFRIDGQCRALPSQFSLEGPNFATVTTCWHALAQPPKALGTASDGTIDDQSIRVLEFKDVLYPRIARLARFQGLVVVRIELDETGRVINAKAVSGKKSLAAVALDNIKQWRFRPNAQRAAVIVYHFWMPGGTCESAPSLFLFRAPNLATVVGCDVTVQ